MRMCDQRSGSRYKIGLIRGIRPQIEHRRQLGRETLTLFYFISIKNMDDDDGIIQMVLIEKS